jgi:hypothetical protein
MKLRTNPLSALALMMLVSTTHAEYVLAEARLVSGVPQAVGE